MTGQLRFDFDGSQARTEALISALEEYAASVLPAPETCPYCGETAILDVLEYWPEERAWMFDTCCEQAHCDACAWVEDDPRGFGKWFEEHTGRTARRGYSSTVEPGALRLDFGLEVGPVPQKVARQFIKDNHRHNDPPAGWRWGHGIYNGGQLVAVAWVGRPVARRIDHKTVADVNRLCVNPELDPELTWNACSMLYAAAAKEAKRRRYKRIITYTLESETGHSLAASGWVPVARTKGGSWDRKSRPREDKAPTCPKIRWAKGLNKGERKKIAKERIR
jgi:hypothetical protein